MRVPVEFEFPPAHASPYEEGGGGGDNQQGDELLPVHRGEDNCDRAEGKRKVSLGNSALAIGYRRLAIHGSPRAPAEPRNLNFAAAPRDTRRVNRTPDNDSGLLRSLVGDGRPLLALVALGLIFSGAFALFLSATGHFLPHDVRFLGMQKEQLCGINQCRIVHFMFHDRVSFGGALIAIGILYLWLLAFPLKAGEPWAWWVFLVSGVTGFGSFLAYLGYGYLDSWHGIATLFLLPIEIAGLVVTWRPLSAKTGLASLFRTRTPTRWRSRLGFGRLLFLFTGAGLVMAGTTILIVGMTTVFVPQDIRYIGLSAQEFNSINPRLMPLIAHDRAGFGGGIATCGLVLFFCVWCGKPSRALWQAVVLAGGVGFSTAIGVHPLIGYNDFTHLAPAYVGAVLFTVGAVLSYAPMHGQHAAFPSTRSPATTAFESRRADD